MDMFLNKFMHYAEITFYIILVSVLMTITAVPIITAGAAVTSACKIFLILPDYDYSISVKDILKLYFKCFISRLLPATITTGWFIIIIYSVIKAVSLIKMNVPIMSLVFLIMFELTLLFQIIFILYADNQNMKYFDVVINSLIIVHKFLILVIPMVLIQLIFFGIIVLVPWTLIIMTGLSFFINIKIYNSKIKSKIKLL